ncbi:MAG: DoxX family membrane protein [bacterium]|nr:DoxX family membrane protein [bacterium]
MDTNKKFTLPPFLVSLLLRIGLASVFLYAGIAAFIEPDSWIGYLPMFLRKMFPAELLLMGFSTVEILLSLWLLSGKKILYAAAFSSCMLLGIIVANFGAMDIIFRDFAILFSALALVVLSYNDENR